MGPALSGQEEEDVKSIIAVLLIALSFLVAAGGTGSASGLRGTVLLDPGYPVCTVGTPCTRPAAHALLRFWRNGRVVAHTRTDSKGKYRIALRRGGYTVTSITGAELRPVRVSVATNRYRRVTFRLDTGIR
jgi:hypothetical protein